MGVISECLADLYEIHKVVPFGGGYRLSPIGSPSDLIDVSAQSAELRHAFL
jgi:hypothetical protein